MMEQEKVTCAACGAEFESQEQLDEHVRTVHGEDEKKEDEKKK